MTLNELASYFDSILKPELYSRDPSLNGVQITNSAPDSKQITKVAFATDACVATAELAVKNGAQLLFTHHGLFWGGCQAVTGTHYQRIKAFLQNDLALYASHIPLDAIHEVGNNFGIAGQLGLKDVKPFGFWHGMELGAVGDLEKEVSVEELSERLFPDGRKILRIYPFGKQTVKRVAVISGGAADDADQAYAQGADCFITGEVTHQDFHVIKELGMTVIEGGHYQTETFGVQLMAKKLENDTGLKTIFIDFNTGL
ncbi:MAG: Nif3-like dinuclear metal center hexameric protein [Treponema sp.]|nr:Nif3-like dinuclear metal center hexameric protein [Treponema sp.]